MIKRFLGAAGIGVLLASVGALTACGSSPAEEESTKSGTAALESANVSIDLHDENGSKIGEGAGVLIAPNLVLTSAHLVAGKTRWTITTADGKTTANGKRGITYDWHQYDSLKAHPRKHDVAVIYLDKPIQLAAYPKVANAVQAKGTAAMRVRHLKGSFELVPAELTKVYNFPHAYTAAMSNSETVSTGGAVVNGAGEIVGVVTGRGMQSGALYIARTAGLSKFLSSKIVCAGGKTDSLGTRTYTAPPPKPGCEDGGKIDTDKTDKTDSSDKTDKTDNHDDSSTKTDDGENGSTGGGTCDDGAGNCSGKCSKTGSDDTSDDSHTSSSDDAKSDSDKTKDDSSTKDDTHETSKDDTTSTTPSKEHGNGGHKGDEEVCEGPDDNADECPPEAAGCEGKECGGTKAGKAADSTIDYGNCACSSTSGTGSLPVVR